MNNEKSFAKLVATILIFGTATVVFTGSSVGNYFTETAVENGKLGLPSSELISKIIEIGFSILTALIGAGLFSKSKWIITLIETLKPLFGQTKTEETLEFDDYAFTMLKHAISTKNKQLTLIMIEELAGEPYLTEVKEAVPVFPGPKDS